MLPNELIRLLEEWFLVKASLYRRDKRPFLKAGELWWCSIGMNVGDEEFGKGDRFVRPVLVFKKISNNLFLDLPTTTRNKKGSWYVDIVHKNKKRAVMLNQARVFDSRRLLSLIGTISEESFRNIKATFKKFYTPE